MVQLERRVAYGLVLVHPGLYGEDWQQEWQQGLSGLSPERSLDCRGHLLAHSRQHMRVHPGCSPRPTPAIRSPKTTADLRQNEDRLALEQNVEASKAEVVSMEKLARDTRKELESFTRKGN